LICAAINVQGAAVTVDQQLREADDSVEVSSNVMSCALPIKTKHAIVLIE
jgi:hypothetical protein